MRRLPDNALDCAGELSTLLSDTVKPGRDDLIAHYRAVAVLVDRLNRSLYGWSGPAARNAHSRLQTMRADLDSLLSPNGGDVSSLDRFDYLRSVERMRLMFMEFLSFLLELRYPPRTHYTVPIGTLVAMDGLVGDVLTGVLSKPPQRTRAKTAPAAVADRLITVAIRILPPEERERYVEQFRAEMIELTRAGQLKYAVSMLFGAFALRSAIKESANRSRNNTHPS